jgi:DNA-directed RNA polymerase subunit RPC12/RpoP
MVLHYKCPHCGSDMVYDADSGKLVCPSCRAQFDVDEADGLNAAEADTEKDTGADETVTYHCDNCGADLMALPETAATTCSFCGAGVVIAERVTGRHSPHYVIPFAISREEAIKAFRKWCRNGLLTPRGFMTADRIRSITGIYVPFWLYDLNSRVRVRATGTKVRTYTRGDYLVTETSYYDVYRELDLHYVKVPVDASVKMDDKFMDRLEPYDYSGLKAFRPPYLAGYLAEKYQYTDDELLSRAKNKIRAFIESAIRSSLSGYTTVTRTEERIDTRNVQSHYVLLPVWLVVYDLDNFKHNFVMNGQTGKIVGKPPLSRAKIAAWFGGVAAGTLLVMKTVSWAMGGGFL